MNIRFFNETKVFQSKKGFVLNEIIEIIESKIIKEILRLWTG